MADRVFIIPLRNDLVGINMNLSDLHPVAGQRNSIYDGNPQNAYIAEMQDPLGVTVTNGGQACRLSHPKSPRRVHCQNRIRPGRPLSLSCRPGVHCPSHWQSGAFKIAATLET